MDRSGRPGLVEGRSFPSLLPQKPFDVRRGPVRRLHDLAVLSNPGTWPKLGHIGPLHLSGNRASVNPEFQPGTLNYVVEVSARIRKGNHVWLRGLRLSDPPEVILNGLQVVSFRKEGPHELNVLFRNELCPKAKTIRFRNLWVSPDWDVAGLVELNNLISNFCHYIRIHRF